MIRLIFPLHRKPELSREEFQRYWREQHGPLVASVARALRVRRYVQSHTVDDPFYDGFRAARVGMQAPHDGIASLWWDTRDELVAAMQSPEGQRAGALLLEDEARFIDFGRSSIWLAQEVAQINPMPENSIVATPLSSWIKFCYLLQPKPGLSWAECHKTWNMDHGYLIRRRSGCTRFARYIQSHTLEDPMNEALRASRNAAPPYAGLTEAWFDRYDLVAAVNDPTSEAAQALQAFLEDEKRFIDFTRSSMWAAKERVFVDESTS